MPQALNPDVGNFTFVNLTTGAHLAVNSGGTAPQLSAAPADVNETWIAQKSDDGTYRFLARGDSGKSLQANGSALELGTDSLSSRWLVDIDYRTGGYALQNAATGAYLADQNGTLTLLPALPDAKAGCLWKFKDFFALAADPDMDAEFVLRNFHSDSYLQSDLYLQYESIFSANSAKTLDAAAFNPIVDETVRDANARHGYSARSLDICQRFTFEKVGTGEDAYYHILPYLRLPDELKGSHRTEYRLIADRNTVKIAQMTVTNGVAADPASGRWKLEQLPGGLYLICNVASGTPKYLSISGNLTAKTTQTLWDLKAICLNMEKDYQQYNDTCGAASGKMIVNYLIKTRNIDVSSYPEPTFCDHQFIRKYKEVNGLEYSGNNGADPICRTINAIVGTQLYTCDDNDNALGFHALNSRIKTSLDQGCPVFIQIKPKAPQASVMGYYYGEKDGGHYFVVKGCYYNSAEGRYDSVVNETHYKFGMDSAKGFYWSETHTHPQTKAPGGRDLVLPAEMLHTIYMQRTHGMIFKA